MSELIDREATVKQICKMGEMLGIGHDRDVTIAVALFVQDDKYAFPTVDRPHGEWKEFTVSTYRGTDEWGEPKWGKGKKFICKRCGRRTVIRENFCPNCGADMREGEANGQ